LPLLADPFWPRSQEGDIKKIDCLASAENPLIIMYKKRWNMDEKWIYKMIQQSFQQYELEGSLSEKEAHELVAKVIEKKQEETEWFEIVEDVVYGYVTNQEL
jgi:hypothetical protein